MNLEKDYCVKCAWFINNYCENAPCFYGERFWSKETAIYYDSIEWNIGTMPPEYDSMFAKLKGTSKWNNAMWEKQSDDVLVTIEFDDGTRAVTVDRTMDGKWRNISKSMINKKVIAYAELPKPYKGE